MRISHEPKQHVPPLPHVLLRTGERTGRSRRATCSSLRLLPTKRPSRSKPGQLVGTIPGCRPGCGALYPYSTDIYPCIPVCQGTEKGRLSPAKLYVLPSPSYVAWQPIPSVASKLYVAWRISPRCSNTVLAETAKFARTQSGNHCSSRLTADCSPTTQLPSHRSPSSFP
ncbi:hypothetical protein LY78DRAFT_377306 [Colletotrichum sublineola]|nr:hypothetical protein LY78DRAFT_377306 [Colletotrichum sublineola]